MGEANTPVCFIILSELVSGKLILKNSLLSMLYSFLFIVLALFLLPNFPKFSLFILLPSLFLFTLFFIEFQRKKSIICHIAVNLAHPWVEEEHDVDEAEVAYRSLDKWDLIPREGRIRVNNEEHGFIIDDGENEILIDISKPFFGASLFAGNEKIKSELIRWLNLSLAIRDAQNSVEDEIEHARIREDDADIDVERIWPATNPGVLNVKPGAIFRNFPKAKK